MDQETMQLYAQRYKWLREQHWSESPLCVVADPQNAIKLGHMAPFGETLDGMVDRAMAGVSIHDVGS